MKTERLVLTSKLHDGRMHRNVCFWDVQALPSETESSASLCGRSEVPAPAGEPKISGKAFRRPDLPDAAKSVTRGSTSVIADSFPHSNICSKTLRRKQLQPGKTKQNNDEISLLLRDGHSSNLPLNKITATGFAPVSLLLVKPHTSMLGAEAVCACAFPYVAICTPEEHNAQLLTYRKPANKVSNRPFCQPLVCIFMT